jgi:hypothetical protein
MVLLIRCFESRVPRVTPVFRFPPARLPMRHRARRAVALLVLVLSAPSALAEDATVGLDEAAARFSRDRRRLVEESLPLTAAEAEKFWPLYEKLQKEITALTEKRRAVIAEFGENYDDMSDATARKLMIDRLELEEARCRLLKAYLPKFEKVLPVKKLARYFQIEGKITASVDAGIAEELPLIK